MVLGPTRRHYSPERTIIEPYITYSPKTTGHIREFASLWSLIDQFQWLESMRPTHVPATTLLQIEIVISFLLMT
jgi:hypothetical protein